MFSCNMRTSTHVKIIKATQQRGHVRLCKKLVLLLSLANNENIPSTKGSTGLYYKLATSALFIIFLSDPLNYRRK